jgi:hypothetical protein
MALKEYINPPRMLAMLNGAHVRSMTCNIDIQSWSWLYLSREIACYETAAKEELRKISDYIEFETIEHFVSRHGGVKKTLDYLIECYKEKQLSLNQPTNSQ